MWQPCGLPARVGPSIADWHPSPISNRLAQSLDLLTRCRSWICSPPTWRHFWPKWAKRTRTNPLPHPTLPLFSIPAHSAGTCLPPTSPWWPSLCCSVLPLLYMLPSTAWHRHCTISLDAIQPIVIMDLEPKSIHGRWPFLSFSRDYVFAETCVEIINQIKIKNELLQLLEALRKTSVDINGTHLVFDSNGNPNIGYNLLEWVWEPSGLKFVEVGSFHKTLDINVSLFKWHTADSQVISESSWNSEFSIIIWRELTSFPQVPESTCSADCGAGQVRRVKGFHSCCFDCINCLAGTYQKNAGNLVYLIF